MIIGNGLLLFHSQKVQKTNTFGRSTENMVCFMMFYDAKETYIIAIQIKGTMQIGMCMYFYTN